MKNSDISVGIIDDDIDFTMLLSLFLKKIGVNQIQVAHSMQSGKDLVNAKAFDLLILDIDLKKGESGIELGKYVRELSPETRIVFFTNNYKDEYYQAAKVVQPNAFLDKDLSELKVRQAVELAFLNEKELPIPQLATACHFADEFIFVKVGMGFKKIQLSEIEYIVYRDQYAHLVLGDKQFPLNMTMKELVNNLPPRKFAQIHQSYIVNLSHVNQISPTNSQVEITGKTLPIGTTYKKQLLQQLKFFT
jgi:DNA-binding LytR/AlgR family response regulator